MSEILDFIEALTGDPNSPVQWQVYHDSDKSDTGKILAKTWYANYHDSAEFLNQRQLQGCGVYVTVNQTDGTDRRVSNITGVRACFIDGDNQSLPSRWAVDPDLVVSRSDTQWHAYWLVSPDTDFTTWQEAQYKIAIYYGVKDRLHDLPRVMRAPGFKHQKNPTCPETYKLIYRNPEPTRKTLTELIQQHPLTPQQQQEFDGWASSPKQKKRDLPDVIDDSDKSRGVAVVRLSHITPEQGDYNNTLYRAANICKDEGLPIESTVAILTDWWINTWPIPVEPKTIETVCANSYKYGNNPVGANTTAGKFAAAPPLVHQVGSPEDLRAVVDGLETSDVKYAKNHTVNARVFLQTSEREYLTVNQETYVYEGTHWRRLEPNELETHVLDAMIESRPNADNVSSTCKLIRLLTTNNSIRKSPSWIIPNINNPKPNNFIAFKNGLLDINTDQWYDHTPTLFYTHCLKYDYDPQATYTGWLEYLRAEVFNDDESLIQVLQEWMGYMLVQNYDFQRIAIFLGAPRSGKGTVSGVIRHLVGSHNVIAPTLARLVSDATLDMMQDKPVAIVGDAHKVPYGKRDEVLETLKSISGCDPVTFNRKYIAAATCKFPTRFTLCANKMPEFLDSSGAMAGRLLVIPFRNSYLGREDPKRLEKLLSEAPGILNWSLIGLRRLQQRGKFTTSEDSEEIMQVLREELSPVSAFINDCIKITGNRDDFVEETDCYNIYRQWCSINDVSPLKSRAFKSDFSSTSYQIRRVRLSPDEQNHRPRVFNGVRITQDFQNVTPGNFAPGSAA